MDTSRAWSVAAAALALIGVHTRWYVVPGTGDGPSLAAAHPGRAFAIQLLLVLPALVALVSAATASRPDRAAIVWGSPAALAAFVLGLTGLSTPGRTDVAIGALITLVGAFGLFVAYTRFLSSLPEPAVRT